MKKYFVFSEDPVRRILLKQLMESRKIKRRI
jgi:hypothetical protein